MNCSDDWIDPLTYSMLGNPVFVGKKKDDCGLAVQKWFEKNPLAYRHYSSTFGRKPELVRKNARCIVTPHLLNGVTIDGNGNLTLNYEVGKMNVDNLKRLRKYLESKSYCVCGICNDEFFQLPVIRIVFETSANCGVKELARDLKIPEPTIQDITGDMVFIQTSALCRHLNDDGVLEFEKPFNLKELPFQQKYQTLSTIGNQLQKELELSEPLQIDIWDNYLMIKTGRYNYRLTRSKIANALNIPESKVKQIVANKWYYIKRWDK